MRREYDSRYDSRDSLGDSREVPPRRPGLGIAALCVATVAVLIELVGIGVVCFTYGQLKAPGTRSADACGLFLGTLVGLVALALCTLAANLVGVGLGIGGITVGRGVGRRLGIYAVALSVVSLLAVVGFIAWILAAEGFRG